MPPKSKYVEGIVVIIDVGPSVRAGSDVTFYNQSKQCLINILQRKIFAEKCRDMVGVVLMGTDHSKNQLANGNQYQNITVLQHPKIVDWGLINSVKCLIRGNSKSDWLDALVVAMDLLHDPENLFITKKIVLMTDFSSEFSDSQADIIIANLKKLNIELSIIGPSVENQDENGDHLKQKSENNCDSPLNWNGKPKSNIQLAGETVAKRIVAEVDGIICSFDEAIPQLIFFERKTQGSSVWNVKLEIGSNLQIPVTGKIKVKHMTTNTWKKVFAKDENSAIISETSYHKLDENQSTVEEEDVISGYKYGSSLVPFSDEDMQLHYNSNADAAKLQVLGFTRSSTVPLNLRAGDQVMVITARDHDDEAAVALSAIIQGLSELDMVAVTRKIYRKNLNPVLGALYPDITNDYECLIWIGLPFQEDVRHFSFPSLNKTFEKITDDQRNVMDELITKMDVTPQSDDDDDPLDPMQMLNPQLQHFFNSLMHRALSPDELLPDPTQHVINLLSPPNETLAKMDSVLEKMKNSFPLKNIEIKKKTDKMDLASVGPSTSFVSDAPISTSDLLGKTVTKVTTATPASDFKSLLMAEAPNYNSICQQMENVIQQMVDSLSGSDSTDNILLTKIINTIKVFREEAAAIDPTPYNNCILQIKQAVLARSLERLWMLITQDNLGQISTEENLKSKISVEEAESFMQLRIAESNAAATEAVNEDAYDDMLDDL